MSLTNNTTQEMSYLTIGSNTYEIVDANAARLNSPAFTGTPTAPTPTTNSGIATKEYVDNAIGSSGGGTITEVKTNAGTHTTIDVTQGIAEFNVPTTYSHVGAAASSHTHGNITNGGDITATAPTIANGDQLVINDNSESKITNGPTFDGSTTTKALTPKGTWETFATSDTNTTYTLSNALSSHKFTETLTAGGSGSGTSTATMEFVAGTGITLTDDTTNKKITIASSVVNTDENVKSTVVTAATTNYLVGSTTSSTTTGGLSKHASGVLYTTADSATSGYTQLRLGNTTATSSAGGKEGQIRLYGTNATYYVDLKAGAIASSNKTITFPNATGTVALTSDIPTVPTNVSAFTNDAGYITGYTETDPVFSASAASGITSSDITNWNNKTSNTGTITGVKTTAGTHTTIDVSSGAANFNVPTKTSHLTNDSGFITSYTDENMKWTASTATNTYYPLQSTSTATTSTANTLNSVSFYQYYNTAGGYRRFTLGNATAYTSTGGAYGTIRLYGTGATYYGDLNPGIIGTNSLTGNRVWTLPDATGTIALTSDIPSVPTITLNGSTSTTPSFYAPTSAGTSGYYLKSNGSGAPSWTSLTIPSITLNGSSTTSPSFYAPTSAGTSGYYLKSNGSGAPSWTSFPTIPSITLNGSSTTSPSFYAPTTAGTSGYYLKSNGSGAPTWAAVEAGGVSDVTVAGTSVVTNNVATIAAPVQIVRW